MHRFIPSLAARQAPRYTSYPTAAEFHDDVGAADQAPALAAVGPDEAVSLYVHIPYCHEICWYCGCNTGAIGRAERIDAYLAALTAEAATVGARLAGRVTAVHFGGGSPNALSPGQFAALAGRLRGAFAIAPDAEWAVEIDPRHFTADHARAYADAGVRRLSIGAQSFSPRVQAAIGRIQPLATVARAIADARGAGIDRINLDLMYGLPGQTMDDIAATIAAARRLMPDRVAMFGYAHMPRLLPRQRRIDPALLPGVEARFWQRALAHDLWVEAGFDPIGFDHFACSDDSLTLAARTGRLRRNFQGFTDDPATTLIGLGSTAISQFDDLIVQNEKHVGSWRQTVLAGRLGGARGVRRNDADRLAAQIIERLLCDGAVDVAELAADHNTVADACCHDPAQLDQLASLSLVRIDGWRIAITEAGQPYARLAAAAFDRFRCQTAGRFSMAV